MFTAFLIASKQRYMKYNILYITLILCLIVACEKDYEMITVSSITDNELIATTNNVALSNSNNGTVVLSFAWSTNELTVSSPDLSAPELYANLEISKNEDFEGDTKKIVVSDNSKAFTGAELNNIAADINLVNDVENLVYFRLATASGSNIASTYSNVLAISITPYEINMSKAFVLNSDQVATEQWLYSENADGIYTGFLGVSSWYNFYVQEGNGAIWGNESENYTPFVASANNPGNFWFPEPAGSYYVKLDTEKAEWQAMHLESMSVSGDIAGEMTFDRQNNIWYLPFTASVREYAISLSAIANSYNANTGDAAFSVSSVAFEQNGEKLSFAETAKTITLSSTVEGEYALLLDLSDATNIRLSVGEKEEDSNEIPAQLFLIGVDDLASGGWTFENSLPLIDSEKQMYRGIVNVNSQYGYQMSIAVDNWNDVYAAATDSEDPLLGNMIFADKTNNIPAPAAGTYFFDVSISNLTYKLSLLGDVVYVSGIDDVWDFNTTLAKTADGVYSGSITFTKETAWGFKIYLFEENWDLAYGGSDGTIYHNGDGFVEDALLGAGTYTMTVDFVNETYIIK